MGSSKQKSTTTGWAPAMQQAQDVALPGVLQQFQDTQNSPLWQSAQSWAQNALDPSFLDPMKNPYFSTAYDTVADDIQSRISAQWGRAGRGSGNTAVGPAVGQGIAAGFAPTLGNMFQQNQQIQAGAAGMAPSLVSDPALQQYLANIGGLAGLGQQSTTTSSPSLLQTIAGVGLTGAGIFGSGGFGPFLFGGGSMAKV